MSRTGYTRAPEPERDPGAWKISYTVAQAAEALGVGTTTIYEAIRAGDLEHRWLGAKLLIPRTALLAWLDTLPQDSPR